MLGLNRESVAIESQWDLGKEPNKVPRNVKTKGGQQEKMILAKRGRNSEEIWKSPPSSISFRKREADGRVFGRLANSVPAFPSPSLQALLLMSKMLYQSLPLSAF